MSPITDVWGAALDFIHIAHYYTQTKSLTRNDSFSLAPDSLVLVRGGLLCCENLVLPPTCGVVKVQPSIPQAF